MSASSFSISPPANWIEPSSRVMVIPSRTLTVALKGPCSICLDILFLRTLRRLGRSGGLSLRELSHPCVVPLLHLQILFQEDLHRDLALELLRGVEEEQRS